MTDDRTEWNDQETRTVQGASPPERGNVDIGTMLASRYLVTAWLGSGGMGSVYQVTDRELDESVALKLLHPQLSSQPDHRARIRSEVRLARRVSHPNVCRVHDIGQHERHLFVTMELLGGPSLRRLMDENPDIRNAPLAKKIDTIVQICAGLSAAHRAGVLHRDVKPDNVIVESDRVVLTDFGVASLASLAREQRLAGTPAYMAPEVLGDGVCDERVDVYSVAVLAYELLAGKRPYRTPNLDVVKQRALDNTPVPPLPEREAEVEARLLIDRVLAHALSPNLDERIRTVDAFAEGMARAARGDEPDFSRLSPARSKQHDQGVPATLLGWSTRSDNNRDGLSTTMAPAGSHEGVMDTQAVALAPTPAQHRRRAEVRVSTILHVEFDGVRSSPRPPSGATQDTPLSLHEPLERAVVDLGGTPLSMEPNSLSAVFGAPVALGDDAARAARAALTLLSLSQGGRAGLDTGRILYRSTSSGKPAASGDPMNNARLLCERASVGQVLSSPACARHLVGRYSTVELTFAPASPEHGQALEPAERALLVTDTNDSSRHPRPDASLPLAGRESELALLESLVKRVCETRSPGFATVFSTAGMGKSRLLGALMERVTERRDIEWLTAPATPLGEGAPSSVLLRAHPEWYAAASREGLRDAQAAFSAARRWLELRAARRPVGVLIEDLHWCDDTSLGFLQELRQTLDRVPVFVLMTARPTLLERAPAWIRGADIDAGEHIIMELAPLAREAARALAERTATSANEAEIDSMVERAGGNPFFVQELARHFEEYTHQGGPAHVPETVEASLQARLDRLPAGERELCRAAAVVGVEFWRDAARAALAPDHAMGERDLDEALAELERRDIVCALPPSAHVDDDRYAFHSALLREVAYQQLAPRERRQTHSAVAEWLEQHARATGAESPAMVAAIARHRDLAGAYQAARRGYQHAGEMSLAVFAYRDAARLLSRARALSETPDAGLLEALGDAQLSADSVAQAETCYQEALELVANQPHARARLCQKIGYAARQKGSTTEAIDWFERGLREIAPDDRPRPGADLEVLSRLYAGLGWILGYRMGQNERALGYCERAVALLEDDPTPRATPRPAHRRELARALGALGAIYMRVGRWRDQLSCNQRNLDIALELGDLTSQAVAHCNLGIVYWSLGEIADATEHTQRGLALGIRTGHTIFVAVMRSNLCGLLLEAGRYQQATAELNQAIRLAERTGSQNFLPETYTFAARIEVYRGDLDAAEQHARKAVELAAAHGSSIDEGIACRILGAVLAVRGDVTSARASFEHAYQCLGRADVYEYARTQAAEARFLRMCAGSGVDGERDLMRAHELRAQAAHVFRDLGAARELERLADDREVR